MRKPAESETPDVVLTADTEITEEDIQKVYASIKESVTTEYLEPNGIDPADFQLASIRQKLGHISLHYLNLTIWNFLRVLKLIQVLLKIFLLPRRKK